MNKPIVGQTVYTVTDGIPTTKIVQKIGRIYFYIADKEYHPEHTWSKVTLKRWMAASSYTRNNFQVYESIQAIRDEKRMDELKQAINGSLFGRNCYTRNRVELPLDVWEDIASLIEPWRK